MKMVKVKTAELEGKALDWAVANAIGWQHDEENNDWLYHGAAMVGVDFYSPSADWNQCGPLIDMYKVGFGIYPTQYFAAVGLNEKDGSAYGSSHAIAACRAIVAAELGDEVEVPEVLL